MADAPATPTPPGFPASLPSDDELMGLALAEARAAAEREPADVPIGAVVLGPSGDVIGRGHNVREALADPTGHAEVVALREAMVVPDTARDARFAGNQVVGVGHRHQLDARAAHDAGDLQRFPGHERGRVGVGHLDADR